MRRVERAAEQADPALAPVGEKARKGEEGVPRAASSGIAQGRTWPPPRTMYL
jgi:hypothetical protein